DLEGADGLEVLQLEPDLGGRLVQAQPDERSTGRRAGDALARGLDVGGGNQKGTSAPTPRSRARRTMSSADARSSTAIPSDSNTVSSSSCSRPECMPASTSPSSALMWSGLTAPSDAAMM